MTPEALKTIAPAITMAIGTIAPAIAIGMIGAKGLDSIGRNPESESAVRTTMILAIAFAEAIAIYVLVVALILKFV